MRWFVALAAAAGVAVGGGLYAAPVGAQHGQQGQRIQQVRQNEPGKQESQRQRDDGQGRDGPTGAAASIQARAAGLFTDVTGSLERQPQGNDVHGEYWITGDDGQRYAVSDGDDGMLGPYAGQRVTVTGSRPGTNAERDVARLEARLVRSHARDVGIPERGMTTLRFAVRPHGQVPERTTFYGVVGVPGPDPTAEVPPIEDLGAVALHDGDDGVYTGTVGLQGGQRLLAQIAKGTPQEGPTEVIHPQSIVQRDNTITLDGDTSVSTTYAPTDSRTSNCTGVRFDGGDLYNLRATGVNCDRARTLATDVPDDLGSSYASHGFACDAQAAAGPRAWSYICVEGDGAHDARITFTAKGALSCGQVGFGPETDHGAFDIRATGVRCDLARSVAAEAVGHVPDEYRSHGFTCGSQATGNELNSFYYNCTKDGAQVSFTAS